MITTQWESQIRLLTETNSQLEEELAEAKAAARGFELALQEAQKQLAELRKDEKKRGTHA